MYHIRMLDPATHELARLDKQIGRRIVKRIHWLAENLGDIKLLVTVEKHIGDSR